MQLLEKDGDLFFKEEVRQIGRVTIRPALGGTVPLFEALSRFFDRKSRFLLQ